MLALKRYYEQLSLITEALAEDTAGLFGEEERRLFVALDRHVDRLLDYVLHLREYVTQVREAYQAQLDYEQNQLMRTFTVMTAIFLPVVADRRLVRHEFFHAGVRLGRSGIRW